jgi:hypothetical protein
LEFLFRPQAKYILGQRKRQKRVSFIQMVEPALASTPRAMSIGDLPMRRIRERGPALAKRGKRG